jgi:hypothetical protein
MMEGGSNLAQIANLNNLVRETEAFGKISRSGDGYHDAAMASDHEEDNAWEELVRKKNDQRGDGRGPTSTTTATSSTAKNGRYANGKRKRTFTDVGDSRGRSNNKNNKGGLPKAKNSLQAALYGKTNNSTTTSNSSKKNNKHRRR